MGVKESMRIVKNNNDSDKDDSNNSCSGQPCSNILHT